MDILGGQGLLYIHTILYRHHGDPHWWPGETPFEIAIGAVLTQNTSWSNVERAILRMKERGMMDPGSILNHEDELPEVIRPAGYYNQKSGYLIGLCRHLMEVYSGDMNRLNGKETGKLRRELLDLKGIGRETADSILCYSLNHPVFVVDAYTRRIFERIDPDEYGGITGGSADDYDVIRDHVEGALKGDHVLLNRFHALIVYLGKDICRPKPLCVSCPLNNICRRGLESG